MKRLSRRDFFIGSGSFVAGALGAYFASRHWLFNYTEVGKQHVLQRKQAELQEQLLPKEGKTIPVAFQRSLKGMVDEGVIDLGKWNKLYSKRQIEAPKWIQRAFSSDSQEPIQIKESSAPFLLNILWALGISNKTKFNERSPLQGKRLPRFASTGGWRLGKEKNGAAYFNKVGNVVLNEDQERLVLKTAESIYRPCCNNSTFFQDCNHGSAMLGLLQLGASQGRSEEELYAIALTANSYWFADKYSKIGLYFEEIEGKSVKDVPAQDILSRKYSSSSGFRSNVFSKLAQKNLLPSSRRGRSGGCSV
jgi:hypothetical protein